MKHASIIPLIGGETIASENAFGKRPDYLLSYTPFVANEKHLLNWYEDEVPYYLLDEGARHPHKVDVVSSVCPCAGLSFLSHGYGDSNEKNEWMRTVAKYVLGEMRPEVYWGENSPHFAGKVGKTVREDLYAIGRENGYSMSVYRTKSLLHGVPQVRERAFYFFWKGDRVPVLEYFNRPYVKIEDLISGVKTNFQTEPINPKTPSRDDPYYRYVLEVIHGGISHYEFSKHVLVSSKSRGDVLSYIEAAGHDYETVANWMSSQGLEREAEKCLRRKAKLDSGGQIMRRLTMVPKDYIGAFVGHYPVSLTHPSEDRYINYREAMSIMGLPESFELLEPRKSVNHICQNVPVQTAQDMASEVRAVLEGKRPYENASMMFQYNGPRTREVAATNNPSVSLEEFAS